MLWAKLGPTTCAKYNWIAKKAPTQKSNPTAILISSRGMSETSALSIITNTWQDQSNNSLFESESGNSKADDFKPNASQGW
jgi:hypothetical protein